MRAAKLENSKRLQRVLRVLEEGGEWSTLGISLRANVCAVNSAVAELRANGIGVHCRRSGDRWLYKLEDA